MVVEAPALIIFLKTFLIATENSTSGLTHIMFFLVQTPPIFLPGKFPTWIVSCQLWLEGQVERLFGSHTFHPMSLDSNCQCDGTGQC